MRDPFAPLPSFCWKASATGVLEAANAEEALLLVQSGQEKIDLLLTGVIMPGKSGLELADALCSRDPGPQSAFPERLHARGGASQWRRESRNSLPEKALSLDALAKRLQEVLAPS